MEKFDISNIPVGILDEMLDCESKEELREYLAVYGYVLSDRKLEALMEVLDELNLEIDRELDDEELEMVAGGSSCGDWLKQQWKEDVEEYLAPGMR